MNFNNNSSCPNTLLKATKTVSYEPRAKVFDNYAKSNGPQSRQLQLIGNGHPRHYFTDGTGRDSYIYDDNGGFSQQYMPIKWKAGGFYDRPQYQKAKPNPIMHAKPIFYRANGTGRDSYIETTAGGQFATLNHGYEYRENFKQSLRKYERSATGKAQRPIFSAYQGKRSNISGKEDQRLFGEQASQKMKKEMQLRKSLNREGLQNVLEESPEAAGGNIYSDEFGTPQKMNRQVQSFSHQLDQYPNQQKDHLTEGRHTYHNTFVGVQRQLNNYQQGLDHRLSAPKHQRKRIIGNFAQVRDQKVKNLYANTSGAFNNQACWAPLATNKLDGRRNYMIGKSQERSRTSKGVDRMTGKIYNTINDNK